MYIIMYNINNIYKYNKKRCLSCLCVQRGLSERNNKKPSQKAEYMNSVYDIDHCQEKTNADEKGSHL